MPLFYLDSVKITRDTKAFSHSEMRYLKKGLAHLGSQLMTQCAYAFSEFSPIRDCYLSAKFSVTTVVVIIEKLIPWMGNRVK